MTVDAQGRFIDAVTPVARHLRQGRRPADPGELTERGLMFKQGIYEHTYPFCWRCDTPLLYYARTTWYIRTTAFKDQLLANNEQINWVPEHIKEGRFGNWLENNVDWALARERYWGTPLPFWMCDNRLRPSGVHRLGGRADREDRAQLHAAALPGAAAGRMARPGTGRRAARPAPAVRGRAHLGLPEVAAARCAACPRWPMPGSTPARCRSRSGTTRSRTSELFAEQFPADFICEADRPDARLVLHAARRQHAALRPAVLSRTSSAWATSWPKTAARCPRAAATSWTRGRCSTSTAPTPRAGTCTPPARPATRGASAPTWWAKWCASSC